MSSEQSPEQPTRRAFFGKLAAGAGAVGAAAAGMGAPAPEAAAAAAQGEGYRETEHVKRYYELAAKF